MSELSAEKKRGNSGGAFINVFIAISLIALAACRVTAQCNDKTDTKESSAAGKRAKGGSVSRSGDLGGTWGMPTDSGARFHISKRATMGGCSPTFMMAVVRWNWRG